MTLCIQFEICPSDTPHWLLPGTNPLALPSCPNLNKAKYITWPTSTERRLESLENQMKKGFTGAIIGKVDGTDIILLYKPEGDLVGRTLLYQEKSIFNRPLRCL